MPKFDVKTEVLRMPKTALADPSELLAARLFRLIHGQIFLVQEQVDEVLQSSSLSCDQKSETLNRVIADVKDWLEVMRDRERYMPSWCRNENFSNVFGGVFDCIKNTHRILSRYEFEGVISFEKTWHRDREVISHSHVHDDSPHIIEFQLNDLTKTVRAELSRIALSRLIDLELRQPQMGIEFRLEPNDFRNILQHCSTISWLLLRAGKIIGNLIVYLDMDPLTDGGKQSVHTWRNLHRVPQSQIAYGELVLTDKDRSSALYEQGFHSYRSIIKSAAESLALFGVRYLLGEVRTGNNANLALKNHREAGFEETPIKRVKNGHELMLVVLSLEKYLLGIPNHTMRDPDHPLFEFAGDPSQVHQYLRSLLREFADPNDALRFTDRILTEAGFLGSNSNENYRIQLQNLSSGRSGILISHVLTTSATNQAIRQVRLGFDEWVGGTPYLVLPYRDAFLAAAREMNTLSHYGKDVFINRIMQALSRCG